MLAPTGPERPSPEPEGTARVIQLLGPHAVLVRCPFCGQTHVHTWRLSTNPEPPVRMSRCGVRRFRPYRLAPMVRA